MFIFMICKANNIIICINDHYLKEEKGYRSSTPVKHLFIHRQLSCATYPYLSLRSCYRSVFLSLFHLMQFFRYLTVISCCWTKVLGLLLHVCSFHNVKSYRSFSLFLFLFIVDCFSCHLFFSPTHHCRRLHK